MEVVAKLRRAGVRALTVDSRQAAPEVAFVALPPATSASHDGRDLKHSAPAAHRLCSDKARAPRPSPRRAGSSSRTYARTTRASPLSWRVSGVKNVSVFGVTGTDGKTSVAWLASELLSALSGGACARLGTLGVQWAGVDEQPGFTTLPAAALHPLLARMAGDGVRWLVMEVQLARWRLGAPAFGSAPVCSRRLRAITSTFTATSSVTTDVSSTGWTGCRAMRRSSPRRLWSTGSKSPSVCAASVARGFGSNCLLGSEAERRPARVGRGRRDDADAPDGSADAR